jgi:hypothetical protein
LSFDFLLHSHSVSRSNKNFGAFVSKNLFVFVPLQLYFVPLSLCAFVFQPPSPFGGRFGDGGFQQQTINKKFFLKINQTTYTFEAK